MKKQPAGGEREAMNPTSRTIFIICGDPVMAQRCVDELATFGGRYRTVLAPTVDQARKKFGRNVPAAIFLDETAIGIPDREETLESAVALLTETAPVVVAAAAEAQSGMTFLITSGAVDFVARTRNFEALVAGLLDRRVRLAERATAMVQFSGEELSGDFGEILRHEVNNPLTGILGNTEMLLARRDRLPPAAVERLETIAGLAVRLRETVRRLSNAWDEHHEQARPA
ncbi:MAG TPA: histidine kinase dimerization/phospho-acceptor domain-containing protein [Candidatus Acidoferrales bacterium]|jgi:signal transduction histidine kinase|nr:histidine kinase dimerization/phospho-acceptor domain-containing protein [Candidatus Acidoferrales bacterium]